MKYDRLNMGVFMMEKCEYCKDLNKEKNDIRIDGIYISGAGYYNYCIPIRCCPYCGTKLKKYMSSQEQKQARLNAKQKVEN